MASISLVLPRRRAALCVTAAILTLSGSDLHADRSPVPVWPGEEWQRAAPGDAGLDPRLIDAAREYALTGDGSGMIVRFGRLVASWGDTDQRFDVKSTTKSIGVTALGLAIADGLVGIDDRAVQHCPQIAVRPPVSRASGRALEVTLRQLATHTAGFQKPGGEMPILFPPGTYWYYSDGGANWLADCLTGAFGRDLAALLFERVFTPIGLSADDLSWRRNRYRGRLLDGVERREFGAGISASANALARIGTLYARRGEWDGKVLLPADFVAVVTHAQNGVVPLPEPDGAPYGDGSRHYGMLWWHNGAQALVGVPADAYWSWGLYDSVIAVVPSLDIVAVRAGGTLEDRPGGFLARLNAFLAPIVRSAGSS